MIISYVILWCHVVCVIHMKLIGLFKSVLDLSVKDVKICLWLVFFF